MLWDTYKKGFDAWESATAKLVETGLKSPLVLEPSGAMLDGDDEGEGRERQGGRDVVGLAGPARPSATRSARSTRSTSSRAASSTSKRRSPSAK